KKKDQVNKSGVKIGAQELSPVTQLFTEPYMVSFLLDNALGAWWANKRLSQDDLIRANNEQELRELAAIPGVSLEYLRFSKEEDAEQWKPAAGGFEKWPEHLSELKTLDPCCGSGHFLVAVFLMLVPMRMQLEGLSEQQAVDAVLRDNIHGLELDQRCVELAAFALALEAWRYQNAGGYRVLPELQLACSGMSIAEAQKEWKDLAKGDEALTDAIAWMQHTFKDAPVLGSLIDPTKAKTAGDTPPWELIQNALTTSVEVTNESKVTTQGLAKAASLSSDKYHWVVTNVPYLVRAKQDETLQDLATNKYPLSKHDLATVFLEKTLEFLIPNKGTNSIVLPQNWLFLLSYESLRKKLLQQQSWRFVVKLGSGAFDTISGEVVKAILISMSNDGAHSADSIVGIDVSESKGAHEKNQDLKKKQLLVSTKSQQLENAETRILLDVNESEKLPILGDFVSLHEGMSRGDTARYDRLFSELPLISSDYSYFVNSPSHSVEYSGRELVIRWEQGKGELANSDGARITGYKAWGKKGVFVARTGELKSTLSGGNIHAQNGAVLLCNNSKHLAPLWAYCKSQVFSQNIRKLDSKIIVASGAFMSAPFDLNHWNAVANEKFINGLPKPFTIDATQWLFHGHPCASVIWDDESKTTAVANLRQDDTVLQVAAARLLGYQWPAELDPEMELAPEMREVMKKNADFAGLIDDDGIV
ncbi:SAM-dependent DNA methyltransferase, partial [Vibrio anguillarum]|uniref:Eco57I restriction-modification methylase domain-containing protein n=1 Tax=Vibrio anguillarum TaxID=55601 RepID=UPI00188CBC22